ncbi:MAG: hypothetical protein FJ109_09220 [Deltaproteobacteria bacterium]|nr:hypothetical protein [Deltaproteobacteria bacterium]
MCGMVLSRNRFDDDREVPYFFWDRKVTVGELRAALADRTDPRRIPLLRALLREARPDEVWSFVTPEVVAEEFESIRPGLGPRRRFWEWLLQAWRDHGFLR